MLNLNTELTVLHDDNSVFLDRSSVAQSFVRDTFVLDYTVSEDALYIGYRKPVNVFYIDLTVLNTVSASLTLEYYKGGDTNAFTSLDHSDDTMGLSRSGFVQWERNPEDEEEVGINGTELYWYKLTWDATLTSTTEIRAINIIFSDDSDLRTYVPSITASRYLPNNETTHVLSHVASRNHILQRLVNDGKIKINFSNGEFSEVNQFDILDVNQLREASTLKTLSIIYGDLSDSPDDKYQIKADMYERFFENTYVNLKFLNIDVDDDGIEDQFEELNSASPEIVRR